MATEGIQRAEQVYLSKRHRHRRRYHTDQDCAHLRDTDEIIETSVGDLSSQYGECLDCQGISSLRLMADFEHIDIEDLPVLEEADEDVD